LKPAISSYNFPNKPILFQTNGTKANELIDYSCIVLTRPTESQEKSFSQKIEKRFPAFTKTEVRDLSRKTTVIVYH